MHVLNYFKIVPCLFLCLFFLKCKNDKSKNKYKSTLRVCNKNLCVETYTVVGGGAYGGDRVSDYLTDSIHFRIYVGTYDNADEGYSYECKDDGINIYKVTGRRENQNKIIDTIVHNLSELKKEKRFD